jgi:beta-ureidopropionase / N-carbamoyl-L-amino-acid hydrolase
VQNHRLTSVSADHPMPTINQDRLWNSLMSLAALGATEKGGVRRLALTPLDGQARNLVRAWFRDVDCDLLTDDIGNIFAIRRQGARNPALPPVAIGSHIDTQPSGGKFDGAYGVMAGLEVMRCLKELQISTERPIAVAIWTNEEGSRFTPVMMGSGVYANAFSAKQCHSQTDLDGVSVAQALAALGDLGTAPRPAFAAYFEPHIEQGPVLERESIVIGVVEGALGQRWFDVTVIGQDAHAGPTPIDLRRDALLGASELVLQVRRIAETSPHYARGTVGQLRVTPNSRNVIPGRVDFTVDLRNADANTLAHMVEQFRAAIEQVAHRDQLNITLNEVVHFPPCAFDPQLTTAIERHAATRGLSTRRLASGAGHDAVYVARTCPTAMIFVPCEGGISHNEIENADPVHLAAGCNVLLDCVLEQAGASLPFAITAP